MCFVLFCEDWSRTDMSYVMYGLCNVLVQYLQTSAGRRTNFYYVYTVIYFRACPCASASHYMMSICALDFALACHTSSRTVLSCCHVLISTHALLALNVTLRSQTQSACLC